MNICFMLIIHFNVQEIYETVRIGVLCKSWRDGELEDNYINKTNEQLAGWDKYGGGARKR